MNHHGDGSRVRRIFVLYCISNVATLYRDYISLLMLPGLRPRASFSVTSIPYRSDPERSFKHYKLTIARFPSRERSQLSRTNINGKVRDPLYASI